jgi:hypothetical protein
MVVKDCLEVAGHAGGWSWLDQSKWSSLPFKCWVGIGLGIAKAQQKRKRGNREYCGGVAGKSSTRNEFWRRERRPTACFIEAQTDGATDAIDTGGKACLLKTAITAAIRYFDSRTSGLSFIVAPAAAQLVDLGVDTI